MSTWLGVLLDWKRDNILSEAEKRISEWLAKIKRSRQIWWVQREKGGQLLCFLLCKIDYVTSQFSSMPLCCIIQILDNEPRRSLGSESGSDLRQLADQKPRFADYETKILDQSIRATKSCYLIMRCKLWAQGIIN